MTKSLKDEELARGLRRLRDAAEQGLVVSPINLSIDQRTVLRLPQLKWFNFHLAPTKVKVTNSGHTVILSAKWLDKRPYINQGPLTGNYVFSQVHFHWGQTDEHGSEHFVDGIQYPLEMHVVYYKSDYKRQAVALRQKDGLIVIGYFFKIEDFANPTLEEVVSAFSDIVQPHTSALVNVFRPDRLCRPFRDDYFLYHGSVSAGACNHQVLWAFNREPISISRSQVASFRQLHGLHGTPLMQHTRHVDPSRTHPIFHVNPSPIRSGILYPLSSGVMPSRCAGGKRGGCWVGGGITAGNVAVAPVDRDGKGDILSQPRVEPRSSCDGNPSPSTTQKLTMSNSPSFKKQCVTVYRQPSYEPVPVKRARIKDTKSIRDIMPVKGRGCRDVNVLICDEDAVEKTGTTIASRTPAHQTQVMGKMPQGLVTNTLICNDEPVETLPNDHSRLPQQDLTGENIQANVVDELIRKDAPAATKPKQVVNSLSSSRLLATIKEVDVHTVVDETKTPKLSAATKPSGEPSTVTNNKQKVRDGSVASESRDTISGNARLPFKSSKSKFPRRRIVKVTNGSSHASADLLQPGKDAVGIDRMSHGKIMAGEDQASYGVERFERSNEDPAGRAALTEQVGPLEQGVLAGCSGKMQVSYRSDEELHATTGFPAWSMAHSVTITKMVNYCKQLTRGKPYAEDSPRIIVERVCDPKNDAPLQRSIIIKRKEDDLPLPTVTSQTSEGNKPNLSNCSVTPRKGAQRSPSSHRRTRTLVRRPPSLSPAPSGKTFNQKPKSEEHRNASDASGNSLPAHASAGLLEAVSCTLSRTCEGIAEPVQDASKSKRKPVAIDVYESPADKPLKAKVLRLKSLPYSRLKHRVANFDVHLHEDSQIAATTHQTASVAVASNDGVAVTTRTSRTLSVQPVRMHVLTAQVFPSLSKPFQGKSNASYAPSKPAWAEQEFETNASQLQVLAEESSDHLPSCMISNTTFRRTDTFADSSDVDALAPYINAPDALNAYERPDSSSSGAPKQRCPPSRRATKPAETRELFYEQVDSCEELNGDRDRRTVGGRNSRTPTSKESPDNAGRQCAIQAPVRESNGARTRRKLRIVSPGDETATRCRRDKKEQWNRTERVERGHNESILMRDVEEIEERTYSQMFEFLALDHVAETSSNALNVSACQDGLASRDESESKRLFSGFLEGPLKGDMEWTRGASKLPGKDGIGMESRKPCTPDGDREANDASQIPGRKEAVASAGQQSRPQSSTSRSSLVKRIKEGKSLWPSRPLCWGRGRLQSPIAIVHNAAQKVTFPPLTFRHHFNTVGQATLRNQGNRAEMKFTSQNQPYATGGPLVDGRYIFHSLSIHWYSAGTRANQHSIDNTYYTTEVHLVHYLQNWGSYDHAVMEPHGVAIVAFFLESGPDEDLYFDDLISALAKIPRPGSSTKLSVETMKFLEGSVPPTGYFAYPGSMTDPPHCDDVIWIVYPDPIIVSTGQIEDFRRLSNHACSLNKPINQKQQPINERPVFYAV